MTPQDKHEPKPNSAKANIDQMLPGGGEMGVRIRSFDWSKTALGAFEA